MWKESKQKLNSDLDSGIDFWFFLAPSNYPTIDGANEYAFCVNTLSGVAFSPIVTNAWGLF